MLHLVFFLAILRDVGRAWSSHRLAQQAFVIWLYAGDINNGVNAHGAGKTEFNGIGPDQLCDEIGTFPSLRELVGGAREVEIVGREPDMISYSISWSV